MKIVIACLLSAALMYFSHTTQATPPLTTESGVPQVQTVRTATPRKEPKHEQQVQTKPPAMIQAEQVEPANGCQTYRHLVEQYDWNARIMLAVMQAESGCNPNAISPVNYDGVRDYGLMQLHGQYILEPSQNVAAAYRLWTVQGYHAWSAYNNGSYGQFY